MNDAFNLTDISYEKNGELILDDIQLTVPNGAIYGFLGPNGAGKTTVMKLLLNLIKPTQGMIEVQGEVITPQSYDYLASIGSIIEAPIFYDHLTVQQNLELHCGYLGLYQFEKIDEKLQFVKLAKAKHKKVSELSLGMKQRLAIARALIADPTLLILDEPINGLDPLGIKEIRELLRQINQELGTTIFISSHIISEIELLCDTIGIIDNGRFVKELSTKEIQRHAKKYIEIHTEELTKTAHVLDAFVQPGGFKIIDDQTIRIYDLSITQKELMHHVLKHNLVITEIKEHTSTLEDFFVQSVHEGEKYD